MLSLVISLLLSAAHAACPDPTTTAELNASVDDAMLSFATLDEEGFIEATDALAGDLRCAAGIMSPAEAAAFHRAFAMRAFWDGKDDEAIAYFRASRRIEPSHILSDKIAPQGGPLATLYSGAGDARAPRLSNLRGPAWTTVYVDGERATRYPEDLPSIFQYETPSDGVYWSGLIAPGASFPSADDARALRAGGTASAMERPPVADVPVADVPVADVPVADVPVAEVPRDIDSAAAVATNTPREPRVRTPREPRERSGSAKGPLLGATVATGVIAAGLFGVSAYSRTQFDDAPSQGRYNLTNGTFFGSIGAAALTVGLGTATIAVK